MAIMRGAIMRGPIIRSKHPRSFFAIRGFVRLSPSMLGAADMTTALRGACATKAVLGGTVSTRARS